MTAFDVFMVILEWIIAPLAVASAALCLSAIILGARMEYLANKAAGNDWERES